MTEGIDDILGSQEPKQAARGHRWKRESRGPLHDLITKALPDFVDDGDSVANLHKLADALDLTYQGVYKWFRPGRKNQIAKNQVQRIVAMSEQQTSGGADFVPVKSADFWEFLPT
ncbi:hypothetical protein [Bosea vestrisii]|uniref:Uncharacterized protein n=1 Tax=Bosea vestrisii TaxID=151416 RepID=A0ABW0HCY9_9HYPH